MAKPDVYVSQIPYRFPEKAMRNISLVGKELGLANIGIELIPLRWNNADYLLTVKNETRVNVAVAGVTTKGYGNFTQDIWNFKNNPKVVKEILMNIAAIGAQSEPGFARRFGTHLELAVALGASYLAMHHEPTQFLQDHKKLEAWTGTSVIYGRKLGWGPQDNRPHILSWDIYAIRDFIAEWKERGSNIRAILPTDTALRTGLELPETQKRYDLLKAWDVLQPRVIQLADYNPAGKKEKLLPGNGLFKPQLAELIQESSRISPGTIYTVEMERAEDVIPCIKFILENYRG